MKREKIAKECGFTIDRDGTVYGSRGKPLKCRGNCKGYKRFKVQKNGISHYIFVHRFQAYMKFGNKLYEKGLMVRHLNGNKEDNSWDNLELGTNSDNQMDIPREDRLKRSSIHVKYPKDVVEDIKKKRDFGCSYEELMEEFNISSKGTLSNIINNR